MRPDGRVKSLVIRDLPLAAALLAAVGACDPPADIGPPTPRAAPIAEKQRPAAVQAPLQRGRLVAGERVERVPVWPARDTIDERVRWRLPEALRSTIDDSPVPVLIPGDPGWAEPFLSSPRGAGRPGHGYAFSARRAGQTIAIQGSRLATLVPGIGRHDGRERLRGGHGFVSDNDGIKTATWIEHGVAYALDLECDSPDSPDCDLDAARAEVAALVYVGGAGAKEGER